jgi:hypothetical protein
MKQISPSENATETNIKRVLPLSVCSSSEIINQTCSEKFILGYTFEYGMSFEPYNLKSGSIRVDFLDESERTRLLSFIRNIFGGLEPQYLGKRIVCEADGAWSVSERYSEPMFQIRTIRCSPG